MRYYLEDKFDRPLFDLVIIDDINNGIFLYLDEELEDAIIRAKQLRETIYSVQYHPERGYFLKKSFIFENDRIVFYNHRGENMLHVKFWVDMNEWRNYREYFILDGGLEKHPVKAPVMQ